MAEKSKVTSKEMATFASKVLQDERIPYDLRRLAGSVLSQAEKHVK